MEKANSAVAVKSAGFGQHVFDLDVDRIQNLLKVTTIRWSSLWVPLHS